MKKLLLLSLAITVLSCNKYIEPETPAKIFEKYQNAVVLITNQYYYEVYLDDKTLIYYSPYSADKIYYSEESILENLSMITGTGFIVSENGEIITNRHIVNPAAVNYREDFYSYNEELKEKMVNAISKYDDTIQMIKNYYADNEQQLDDFEKKNLVNEFDSYKELKEIFMGFYESQKNFDIDKTQVKPVIYRLAIAYNNTHITDLNDLQECVLIRESSAENVDLALIQTKTQLFDKPPKNKINFDDNNPNLARSLKKYSERNIKNPVSINEDVYMIGFNHGFSLANTKQGIKSQFTSGEVSQESDGERILYTIPTLEGSSGSPIIDKWGNLVAVNFAKVSDTQSFSFGVPLKAVKEFYEE
ncbi:MAG: trypsin-like peptidase domain-containing protein [Lutibacter sp.]|nr:trypsin-like peptidase domain-containing protein [Lutibacter sp.]